MLIDAADALGGLTEEVIFVGGATLELWLTDPAAAPPRPTLDVDVVVEVATRSELHAFDDRLRQAGFKEDLESGVICRWRYRRGDIDLVLDVMPTEGSLLGFSNQWQGAAFEHALLRPIAGDRSIRAASPPYLLAMKLEAFEGRGGGDYAASHDLEDVVALVDGRGELVDEIAHADDAVRNFLASTVESLLGDRAFLDSIPMHLRPDTASQEREHLVVLPRLRAIAALRER